MTPHTGTHGMDFALGLMRSMGYVEGMGLGASNQGCLEPINVVQWKGKQGLGATCTSPDQETGHAPPTPGASSASENANNGISDEELAAIRKKQRELHKTQLSLELDTLRQIQTVLQSDFDPLDFFLRFGEVGAFADLELWEALYVKIRECILETTDINNKKVLSYLSVAAECFPRSALAKLITKDWLPMAMKDKLPAVFEFLTTHAHLIPSPALNTLALHFVSSIIKTQPEMVQQAVLVPALAPAFQTCIRQLPLGRVNSADFAKSVLIPYLNASEDYSSVRINGDNLSELLLAAEPFKNSNHYLPVLRSAVFPKWLDQLRTNLRERKNLELVEHELTNVRALGLDSEPQVLDALDIIRVYTNAPIRRNVDTN